MEGAETPVGVGEGMGAGAGFRMVEVVDLERMGGASQKGQPRQRLRGGDEWARFTCRSPTHFSKRAPLSQLCQKPPGGACPTPAGA